MSESVAESSPSSVPRKRFSPNLATGTTLHMLDRNRGGAPFRRCTQTTLSNGMYGLVDSIRRCPNTSAATSAGAGVVLNSESRTDGDVAGYVVCAATGTTCVAWSETIRGLASARPQVERVSLRKHLTRLCHAAAETLCARLPLEYISRPPGMVSRRVRLCGGPTEFGQGDI